MEKPTIWYPWALDQAGRRHNVRVANRFSTLRAMVLAGVGKEVTGVDLLGRRCTRETEAEERGNVRTLNHLIAAASDMLPDYSENSTTDQLPGGTV